MPRSLFFQLSNSCELLILGIKSLPFLGDIKTLASDSLVIEETIQDSSDDCYCPKMAVSELTEKVRGTAGT